MAEAGRRPSPLVPPSAEGRITTPPSRVTRRAIPSTSLGCSRGRSAGSSKTPLAPPSPDASMPRRKALFIPLGSSSGMVVKPFPCDKDRSSGSGLTKNLSARPLEEATASITWRAMAVARRRRPSAETVEARRPFASCTAFEMTMATGPMTCWPCGDRVLY